MTDTSALFADGIMEASVHHGVARLTLAQTGQDGKPVPCGQLAIPVVQLPAFANGVLALLKQIDSRVKQAQQAQQSSADAPAEAPQQVPGSFRFSG
ncbi:hypothetical protein [Roseomonas sp. KE0001]|uniref:hypothetical protein n=1 Tax=unclassified Roseomonas TaxID=2617492 RepID=UPI0018E05927|nr:hypothetical protein [Roseomonas sp. KE0001]MBI0432642.1 hypothetical protein [Roseomonas sp. KE0001]